MYGTQKDVPMSHVPGNNINKKVSSGEFLLFSGVYLDVLFC